MTARGDRMRTVVRGIGQTFITAGVIVLLFVVYELWVTNIYAGEQQHHLRQDIQTQWAQPTPSASASASVFKVTLGKGLAILRIPRLGRRYAKVIVEGVGVEDLKRGPGHYPGTAMPGAIGNFVVSGHRTTYGAPFNRLDELKKGDPVVLETRDTWFVYDVTSMEIVAPTDVKVIAPVPNHPGMQPTQALFTFTTCNPKYSARQRLILHGKLVDRRPKTDGPPAVLGA